jgi:hypothetical protein
MMNISATQRIVASVLALILMAALFLPATLASGEPRITSYSTPGSYTQMGQTGLFTFTLNHLPANLEVFIESGSAFMFSGGTQSLPVTASPFSVTLVYTGSGTNIDFRLIYDTGESTQSIFITETLVPPSPDPTPWEPPPEEPRLTLSGSLPRLTADRAGEISFRLQNSTRFSASNVRVSLVGGAELFHPTSLTGSEVNVGTVSSWSSRDAKLDVNVLRNAPQGYHEVELRITMTNRNGETMPPQTETVRIHITNPNIQPNLGPPVLTVVSSALDKNTPGADGLLRLTVTLRNTGEQTASNVRFALTGLAGAGLTLNESLPTKPVAATLAANATASVTFELKAGPDLTAGVKELAGTIRFVPPGGTETAETDTLYVNIIMPPGPGAPALTVLSSSLDKNTPGADGLLNLTVTLRNTGGQPASNVRITLTGFGGGLFLNEAATKTVTDSLAAGASAGAAFELRASRDIETTVYPLTARIRFAMPDGTEGDTVEETLYLNIIKPPDPGLPALTVISTSLNTNMPGADGRLRLTVGLRNTGRQPASNVRFTLSGLAGTGLSLNEPLATKTVAGTLAAGASATVTYELKAGADLETGIKELNTLIRYRLPDGTEAEPATETLYISVIKPPDPPAPTSRVQVGMVAMNQSTTNPGESGAVTVSISYKNHGTDAAADAVFAFEGLSSSAFTLLGSFGDRNIGRIAPGQTVSLSIPLYAAPELPNGNHPLNTVVTYKDASGEVRTVETMIYLFIKRPQDPNAPGPDSDTSVPRVIISRHSVSEETVTAGNPFELHFTLTNTSRSKDIKNMKVTVTDQEGIFLPVAGVNSFYVADLWVGDSVDLSINLMPKQDAESKSYQVTIALAYEDEDNTQYNFNEALSIPVVQPQRLEISNITFFGNGMGGAQLSFQFMNKGRSPLYNLMITIEGPMMLMEGDYFVGNFAAGSIDFFEDDIIPYEFGELSGFIVLQYEDVAGNPMEYRQEITAWIDEGGGGRPPMNGGWNGGWNGFNGGWNGGWNGENGGFNGESGGGTVLGLVPWLFWTILGIVVTIGAVVTVIVIRKKRRAKELLEDDDE